MNFSNKSNIPWFQIFSLFVTISSYVLTLLDETRFYVTVLIFFAPYLLEMIDIISTEDNGYIISKSWMKKMNYINLFILFFTICLSVVIVICNLWSDFGINNHVKTFISIGCIIYPLKYFVETIICFLKIVQKKNHAIDITLNDMEE